MASTNPVTPVKLFLVSLHQDEENLNKAIAQLHMEFGETDFVSDDFPFDQTDYYQKEMGAGLFRRFYSFARLIDPDRIVEVKLLTNQIENQYLNGSSRTVNLDPGYIDYYKVVLASAKYGGQKIYLRNGIYADMTLVMYKGKWESFAWGFPDFKSRRYDEALSKIRDLYKTQIKT
jgi:hypothetical protein